MQKKAFLDWVQPLSDQLFLAAQRLVVNREDARDIVQETVLKLWETRDRLETLDNPDGWAMRMVINRSLDWLKKHKPIYMDLNEGVLPVSAPDDVERKVENLEKLNTVHRLVRSMSPQQQAIFELREMQGMKYQEIAENLELDVNTVKVNLHRIRKKLKTHCETLDKYGIAKD